MLTTTDGVEQVRPLHSLVNCVRKLLPEVPDNAEEVRVMVYLSEAVVVEDTYIRVDKYVFPVDYLTVDERHPKYSVRLGYQEGNLE